METLAGMEMAGIQGPTSHLSILLEICKIDKELMYYFPQAMKPALCNHRSLGKWGIP